MFGVAALVGVAVVGSSHSAVYKVICSAWLVLWQKSLHWLLKSLSRACIIRGSIMF